MTKLQAAVFLEFPQSGTTSKDVAVLRRRSPEQEIAAHAALLDVAHAFSSRVEDAAADTLLLDLSGLERLHGAPSRMGNDLKSRVSTIGMEASVAVTANPDAALHAALGFEGVTLIPAGREAQRLGVLPVQVLLDGFAIGSQKTGGDAKLEADRKKLREQMLDTLERWGVRDFRSLALLPEHALASRLGQTGVQLRRLARGETLRTLVLCDPPTQLQEMMELEDPVETIESLSFLLNRLLEQLCGRLETRALAAQELCLRLQLQPRVADEQTTTIQELNGPAGTSHSVVHQPVMERVLQLPVPMRDGKTFLKLLQLELAAHPPGAPVSKLWISVQPAPPRAAQRGLFLPVTPEPEKLEITLARINAVVGERRAGIARLLDTHRHDALRVERFGDANQPGALTLSDKSNLPPLAMRMIRPACPIRVRLSQGRPEALDREASAGYRRDGRHSSGNSEREILQGKVLWAAGPWRSSGDWWTENKDGEHAGPWDREEWDVALAQPASAENEQANVSLYRIYHDVGTGHWFADASYD